MMSLLQAYPIVRPDLSLQLPKYLIPVNPENALIHIHPSPHPPSPCGCSWIILTTPGTMLSVEDIPICHFGSNRGMGEVDFPSVKFRQRMLRPSFLSMMRTGDERGIFTGGIHF